MVADTMHPFSTVMASVPGLQKLHSQSEHCERYRNVVSHTIAY